MIGVLGPAFARADGGDFINDDGPTLGPAEADAGAGGFDLMTGLADRTRLALRHVVRDPDRVSLGALVKLNAPQGLVEINGVGSGSLAIRSDHPQLLENPDLLNDGNLIDVFYGDAYLHTWVVEAPKNDTTEDRQAVKAYQGRGDLCLLDNAVLYPERPVSLDTSEDRYFNFGSVDGPWRVTSEWDRPKQVSMRSSYRWPFPSKWPKAAAASWVWTSNPDRASKDGDRYFRATLSLDDTTKVRIFAVGDEDLMLMVDGRVVLRQRFDRWRRARAVNLTLTAGDHLIAARVGHEYRKRHHAAGDGKGAGLLLAIATMGTKKVVTKGGTHGEREVNKVSVVRKVLLRSRTKGWLVRGPRSGPPGWFPSQILSAFVSEAQDRGVLGFDGITLGYTNTHDSAGVPWRHRLSTSYKVGTGGLDLMRQLVERGVDVAMVQGSLHAWVTRGRNLQHAVALDGYTAGSGDAVGEFHPNALLTRYRRGWAEFTRNAGRGRIEAALTAGGSDDRDDARDGAHAALDEYADTQEQFTVVTNSLRGPQPGYHYAEGDVVTSPVPGGGRAAAQVLSIGYAGQEGGVVEWSHTMRLVGDAGDPPTVPEGV